ncbi:MAG: polymer-forming cytoskeletal protein [Chloroflexi bacterium]|nr:polymer-forming cytoskeletal protein [Chloroflexota bacterium]
MKTRSFIIALVAMSCLLVLSAGGALAAEIRSGPTALVAPGETVDDDLFAGGGQTVTISGHVTGDAYAVGETVVVNGSIDGDLIAAAQQVIVDGTIGGNVRTAGATVTINGTVGRSITGFAQHVNITSTGKIGGSVTAVAQTLDAFGPVGRGMTVAGGTLQLAGPVGGPVLARVETLSVAPTAQLAGSLDYQAQQEAALPTGSVNGGVHFTPAPQQAPAPEPVLNGLFDVGSLIGLVGSFLLGAVAIILMPRASARAAELGRQQPWQSFGLGLVALLVTPFAAALVAITLIGLPVAFTVVALYVLGILLAWPAVALVVGTLLARLVRPEAPLPVLGCLAIGLITLHLVTHVAFIGPLVVFCSIVFGLGMLTQAARRWRRPSEPARTATPVAVAA